MNRRVYKITGMATVGSLVLALVLGLVFSLVVGLLPKATPVHAADASGDYRSKATGNWNAAATWQTYDGASWVDAVTTPTSADGVITILNGHTVTVTANVTIDQATVNSGGQVTIGGVNLTVANGAGVDFQVNGTLDNANGTFTLLASSEVRVSGTLIVSGSSGSFGMGAGGVALYFDAGGTLSWNRNGGALPVETKTFWDPNSTCEILGVTVGLPSNINQSYGNFTWNSPSQTTVENLGSGFVSVAGNFTVVNTGSGGLQTATTASTTITVGGSLIQSGGSLQLTTGGTRTVNVGGNFIMSAGTLTMSAGSGTSTIYVSGNFSHTGGTITETSNGAGAFVFNKSGTQTYTSGGTISNTINFTVNSGSTLNMGTNLLGDGSTGAFTLSSGATLGIGDASGITSSGASGNIRVSGTRTYDTAANYTYNGTTGAQATGNGLPATVNNLTINNTAGVTLGANMTVNGILTLASGNLAVTDPNELTMGASATTVGATDVTGIVTRTSFVAGTSYTFGNQYTTLNFQNTGTLPTAMSIKITLSAPSWRTGTILRRYEIMRTGGSGGIATLNLHYLDSELNGNTENKLVLWICSSPFIPGTETEYGRTNYNTTNNWVGTSNTRMDYIATAFGQKEGTLDESALASARWNGSVSTYWADPLNWTPNGIPSDLADVVIPDAATTANDPELGGILAVGRVTLESGAILNAMLGSTVTVSGASGAWSDNGGTFNHNSDTVIFTNANATISGTTDFYNVTINSGAGLTMGSDSIMRIAGTMTNNGTWPTEGLSNATIEYNGADQTVLSPNGASPGYDNLILNGSGVKTMPGTALNIGGDFTISGTATVTASSALTIGGNVTLDSGTTFTGGAYTHNVAGNWTNNGATVTLTGTTINLNGSSAQAMNGSTGTTFNNLTLSNSTGLTISNRNPWIINLFQSELDWDKLAPRRLK